MNTPVSFENAKLLKDKGYGNTAPWKLGRDYYNHLGKLNGDVTDYIRAFVKLKDRKDRSELTHLETIDAPTIAEVVMWLYEKHGIWIEVFYDDFKKKFYIIQNSEEIIFNSPTESYEAGIEYILKNLIK